MCAKKSGWQGIPAYSFALTVRKEVSDLEAVEEEPASLFPTVIILLRQGYDGTQVTTATA